MKTVLRPFLSVLLAYTVLATTLPRPAVAAQDHVVPLGDLRARLGSVAAERSRNAADIERVLSYPAAVEALRKAKVNQEQMRAAVATLGDEELARLATQARASEKDVQGGLITGILALIGLIVVIIVVVALVAEVTTPPAPDGSLPA